MKPNKIVLWLACILALVTCCLCFAACGDGKSNDYPVEGVWHAVAAGCEENTFTFGGQTTKIIDNYKVDFYFDFRADGSVMKKNIMSINNYIIHTDNEEWNIFNVTWSVKGNVLTLSSGRQFVIVDDEFDDTFPAKDILLRYKKAAATDDDTNGKTTTDASNLQQSLQTL